MASHAERIQTILAREREPHARQGQLVRPSLQAPPPRRTAAPAARGPRPATR